MLDPVQQRVLGVLIEKELTVPDSYPLTESVLLAGCNQKSNRDPEMDLEQGDIFAALSAMREAGWVTRVETGARATRYKHAADAMLSCTTQEKAVLCELLVRGPQAPGSLKPRVARLGYKADPAEIRETLRGLANRGGSASLVEEQPKRPRERDQRWAHRLGPAPTEATPTANNEAVDPSAIEPVSIASAVAPQDRSTPDIIESVSDEHAEFGQPELSPKLAASVPDPTADSDLDARVEDLEREISELRAEVARLKDMFG